jgi:hypothetical protein
MAKKEVTKSIPRGAFRFVQKGCHACVFSEDKDEQPKLKMVGYTGGVIENHWYWDDLVIDLTGVKLASKTTPILEDHETSKKIAFSKKVNIDENGIVPDPEKTVFLDTKEALEFIENSKRGFPYQSSIRGMPSIVERVADGESTEVNGFTLKGPGSVWRKCELKEISVCVFGWDSKTQASAFSKEEEEFSFTEITRDVEEVTRNDEREVKEEMDINKLTVEELKAKNPDLFSQIVDSAKEGMVEEAEVQKLSKRLSSVETENRELKKRETIRTQKEQKSVAASIFSSKLEGSDLPKNMFDKIRGHVDYSRFMNEDDTLDTDAFTEAVEKEIKEWSEMLSENSESTVAGGGSSTPAPGSDAEKMAQENDAMVSDLLSLAGQNQS